MGGFVWKDAFSVDVAMLDGHHQRIFAIFEELDSQCAKGDGRSALMRTMTSLSSYVEEHFGAEERYMKVLNYPRLKEHQAQHDSFLDRLHGLMVDVSKENPVALGKATSLLGGWILNHVLESDREYAAFRKNGAGRTENGARPSGSL